jgi:hypothetical protein
MNCRFGFTSRWLLPLAGTALLLVTGCSGAKHSTLHVDLGGGTLPADAPAAVKQAFADKSPVDPVLVAANNGMGMTLFNQVRTPAANVLIPTAG